MLAATLLLSHGIGCKQQSMGTSNAPPLSLATPITIHQTQFAESYTLSNGTVNVVIVPRIGRVMSYGFVGGPNELWTNPLAKFEPDNPQNWINWGGDKTWIWPQEGWRNLPSLKNNWPPPMDIPSVSHTVSFATKTSLRTVSSVIPDLNVVVVREYKLADQGTQLTVKTTFLPQAGYDPALLPGATPWTVTQLPWSSWCVAVTQQPVDRAAIGPLGAPMNSTRIGERLLQLLLPETGNSQKIGIDATHLAALSDHGTLLVQTFGPHTTRRPYPSLIDRAQVFAEPRQHNDRPAGVRPYLELEFTAPPDPSGEPPVLEVVWSLHRITTDAEAKAFMESLAGD